MPETPYLIDSNILLRWVKPDDRDYVSHNDYGVQVNDARLAAAMRVHGIERVLTFQRARLGSVSGHPSRSPPDTPDQETIVAPPIARS